MLHLPALPRPQIGGGNFPSHRVQHQPLQHGHGGHGVQRQGGQPLPAGDGQAADADVIPHRVIPLLAAQIKRGEVWAHQAADDGLAAVHLHAEEHQMLHGGGVRGRDVEGKLVVAGLRGGEG